MNKKLIRNIIIALLAIGLLAGAYIWAVGWTPEAPAEETPQPTEKAEIVVIDTELSDITSIDIKNPECAYTINKNGDDYSIAGYENANLTPASMGSAFSNLDKLKAERIVANGNDKKADFGLSEPQMSVKINFVDGTAKMLEIGSITPTNDGYYASTDFSEDIYLISKYKAEYYAKTPDSYRDTSIASIDTATLKKLEILKDGNTVCEIHEKSDNDTVQNAVNETHIMSYPYNEFADYSKIAEFAEKFSTIEAARIVSDTATKAAEYGIGAYSINLTAGDVEHKLSFGGKDSKGNVYATYAGNDSVFTVSAELLDAVASFEPFDYIYTFVQIFNIDDVKEVKYVKGGEEITLSIDRTDAENLAYSVNSESVEEDIFKKSYQEVLSIFFTSEHKDGALGEKCGSVTYTFNDGRTDTAEYFEFDERNYVVKKSSGKTYLILKKNFDNVISNVNKVLEK